MGGQPTWQKRLRILVDATIMALGALLAGCGVDFRRETVIGDCSGYVRLLSGL